MGTLDRAWVEVKAERFPGEGGEAREAEIDIPTYAPEFKRTHSHPARLPASNFTAVAPEGFKRLEDTLFEGQQAKLVKATTTGSPPARGAFAGGRA